MSQTMTTASTLSQSTPGRPRSLKIRGYKDFLTPSYHRKFTRAAATALVVCYAEAILLGDKSSYFWSWFPLGSVGVRTSLLFISVLVLFVLRVSQFRFGKRTAVSPVEDTIQLFKSLVLFRTIGFYLFSAWWFSEIYVWSASEDSDLSWVKPDEDNGRDRLNERPIFLRSNLGLLAIVMACAHLYYDYDEIKVQQYPVLDATANKTPSKPVIRTIVTKGQERLKNAVTMAGLVTLTNFVAYALVFRRFAWAWSLWFGRLIWDVPRASEPSTIPPYHYTLIFRAFTSSILLACLWEMSNLAFSVLVEQPPIKNNQPLTSQSRDPNGSLINGLVSKKIHAQTSALWELSLISSSFEDRRKTLFTEIDRPDGGSTWKQILNSCLSLIEAMNTRLEDNRQPPPDLSLAPNNDKDVKRLPRLSAPLKADPILQASPQASGRTQRVEAEVGSLVKSIGQGGKGSNFAPGTPTRRLMEKAKSQLFSPERQKQMHSEEIIPFAQSIATQVLSSALGKPFRQTFADRVQTKVFGSPRSEQPALLFAIYSVAQLAVAGITDDTMGTVNRDIPLIMRTLGNVIGRIQKFLNESPVHWTDANFAKAGEQARRVEEIEFLVGYLRAALRHIIKGYEGYARDMGIAPSELRAARMAAGMDNA